MAQAYNITVNLGGIGQAVAGVRQLAQAVNSINALRVAGGGGGRAVAAVSNPAAQIRQQAQILNAQASHMRAQLNLSRASGQGQSQGVVGRLGQFARSTRFGRGGFMPLLGRGLDVLGAKDPKIAIAVMAIVGAVTVATAAIKAFAYAVREGAAALNDAMAARTVSGGTAGQIAALAAAGLGNADIVSASAGLRQRLASDPFAMMAGVRSGIGPQLPRPFGSQNEAKLLQQAMDSLRAMGEGEKQLGLARMLGLDALLPLINVSDRMAKLQKADADIREQILKKNGPAAREFNAALGRLTYNFSTLLQAIAGPGLNKLGGFINYFAAALQGLARIIAANPQLITNLVDSIITPYRTWLAFEETIGQVPKGATAQFDAYINAASSQTAATNANTLALQQNTQAWKNGIYGGGARSRNAIPNSLNGYALQRALQGNSLRLGSFSP